MKLATILTSAIKSVKSVGTEKLNANGWLLQKLLIHFECCDNCSLTNERPIAIFMSRKHGDESCDNCDLSPDLRASNELGSSQSGETRGEKLGFIPLLQTLRGVDGIALSQHAHLKLQCWQWQGLSWTPDCCVQETQAKENLRFYPDSSAPYRKPLQGATSTWPFSYKAEFPSSKHFKRFYLWYQIISILLNVEEFARMSDKN